MKSASKKTSFEKALNLIIKERVLDYEQTDVN